MVMRVNERLALSDSFIITRYEIVSGGISGTPYICGVCVGVRCLWGVCSALPGPLYDYLHAYTSLLSLLFLWQHLLLGQ